MPEGHYQLGSEIVRLNSVYQGAIEAERHIPPVLAPLAAQTQEAVTFYVRQGEDERMCLFRVNSPSTLRLDVQPAQLRPMDGESKLAIRTGDIAAAP